MEWLLHNRRGLDVLVHAVSGDDLKDHTEYALWLGQSLPLKLEVLRKGQIRKGQIRKGQIRKGQIRFCYCPILNYTSGTWT